MLPTPNQKPPVTIDEPSDVSSIPYKFEHLQSNIHGWLWENQYNLSNEVTIVFGNHGRAGDGTRWCQDLATSKVIRSIAMHAINPRLVLRGWLITGIEPLSTGLRHQCRVAVTMRYVPPTL